jgi:hypothetical protein
MGEGLQREGRKGDSTFNDFFFFEGEKQCEHFYFI